MFNNIAITCTDYEQIPMEKLLFSMGNNYIFQYSCDFCIKCGKCDKKFCKN